MSMIHRRQPATLSKIILSRPDNAPRGLKWMQEIPGLGDMKMTHQPYQAPSAYAKLRQRVDAAHAKRDAHQSLLARAVKRLAKCQEARDLVGSLSDEIERRRATAGADADAATEADIAGLAAQLGQVSDFADEAVRAKGDRESCLLLLRSAQRDVDVQEARLATQRTLDDVGLRIQALKAGMGGVFQTNRESKSGPGAKAGGTVRFVDAGGREGKQ